MSEIRPRFYVHKDYQKWIIVRFDSEYACYGSATLSIPAWQAWNPDEDQFVKDGAWVEITYANMRPPTRELDDLRAELKEKTREIERLRAELDSENQTVNTLTRKLKATLDRQEDRRQESPAILGSLIREVMNSWEQERHISHRLAVLETQGAQTALKMSRADDHLDDRIGKVVDNTSTHLPAHKMTIEGNTEQIGETKEAVERLARETAKQTTNLQKQIEDLRFRTYHNTVDLNNLSIRITNLEAKQ